MKYSRNLRAYVILLFSLAVAPAFPAAAAESGCSGSWTCHINPGQHMLACALLDNTMDSLSVYQIIQPTYSEYWCSCDQEDCYEASATLPPGSPGNIWHTADSGCTWGTNHCCDCTQPRSSCCGDLLP